MRKNQFSDIIRINFNAINDPEKGSTSQQHRLLHKMYVQTRVKNGKFHDYGVLKRIESEKIFEHALCGNAVSIVLPDKTVYEGLPEYGDLRIDCYEICKNNGILFTRNVEVLVGYPRNFYFPCSFSGFKHAKDFSYYMLGHNYFTSAMKSKFDSDVRIKRSDFERRNRDKLKFSLSDSDKYQELMKNKVYRVHYHISSSVDKIRKIEYGDFEGMVEVESELERKWKHYYYLADKLSFVIHEEFLDDFFSDAKKILKEYDISPSESRLDSFVTLSQEDLKHRCSAAKRACVTKCKGIEKCRLGFSKKRQCSGEAIIYNTERIIPMPRKKSDLNMKIVSIEDLLN